MRSTWAAAALGFTLACASASSQTGTTEHPAPRATAPAPAAAAPAPAAPKPAPAVSRPMTAAEAAEKAHQEWSHSRGSGGDADGGQPSAQKQKGGADDAPCASDADCTLTRVAPGTCCATLCSPRAVTRARGAELEQRGAECRGCIEPLCRDPGSIGAACQSGRCVAKPVASLD